MKYVLMLLGISLAQPNFAQEPAGLILKYTMDGSCELIDVTATSPSHGVLVDVTSASNVHDKPNSALAFNANTSYITLGTIEKLQLAGDKTITFWIKPTIINSNHSGSIFTYGSAMTIGYQEVSSTARLSVSFGGITYIPQINLTANEWHSVTITFAKDFNPTQSRAVAYIDGVEVAQSQQNKTTQSFTNAIALIGPTSASTLTNGFRGSLDEFKMYNRTLTSVEVLSAILPVKLELFKAKRINGVIELHWKTSLEDNVSHFDIQRSNDGINFETISNIPAGKFEYLAYDPNTRKENTWYRLQIVDKDGKKEATAILKVGPDTAADPSIKMFPNPGTGTINFIGVLNNCTVNIVSATGVIVKHQQTVNKIDIRDIRPGLYYVIIYDNKGNKKMISKFIKR